MQAAADDSWKAFARAGVGAMVLAGLVGCAPMERWEGVITDDHCRIDHVWDEHGPQRTEKDCALQCVTDGATLVLLSDGRAYPVANADDPEVREAAGARVIVHGRLARGRITVTTIEAARVASP